MSIPLTDDSFGKTVHFETYLGGLYRHMRFECLLDAKTAMALTCDAPALHQQYFGSLPPGVPNDYRAYKYAMFYDIQNKPVYLGVPWIKAGSVTESDEAPYVFTVWGITADTANSIRAMMTSNGVESFEVTRPS